MIDTLPPGKRQPNLVLAAARFLYGTPAGYPELRPRWSSSGRRCTRRHWRGPPRPTRWGRRPDRAGTQRGAPGLRAAWIQHTTGAPPRDRLARRARSRADRRHRPARGARCGDGRGAPTGVAPRRRLRIPDHARRPPRRLGRFPRSVDTPHLTHPVAQGRCARKRRGQHGPSAVWTRTQRIPRSRCGSPTIRRGSTTASNCAASIPEASAASRSDVPSSSALCAMADAVS